MKLLKVIFYLVMLTCVLLVINSQMHVLLQLGIIFLIVNACFIVREGAIEIDSRIPTNKEEEIIDRELTSHRKAS